MVRVTIAVLLALTCNACAMQQPRQKQQQQQRQKHEQQETPEFLEEDPPGTPGYRCKLHPKVAGFTHNIADDGSIVWTLRYKASDRRAMERAHAVDEAGRRLDMLFMELSCAVKVHMDAVRICPLDEWYINTADVHAGELVVNGACRTPGEMEKELTIPGL